MDLLFSSVKFERCGGVSPSLPPTAVAAAFMAENIQEASKAEGSPSTTMTVSELALISERAFVTQQDTLMLQERKACGTKPQRSARLRPRGRACLSSDEATVADCP